MSDEARSAAFPRGWKRLRNNWAQSWSLGRFELEVEWVPRGHSYMVTFSVNSTKKQLARMGG